MIRNSTHKSAIAGALATALLALGACSTTPAPGPVSVSRFVDANQVQRLGRGTVFVETAPGVTLSPAEMAEYKAAVARDLARQGYQESSRDSADTIAEVSVDRYVAERGGTNRSPINVGVGGSTGSYGSGLGLGIGINLGGSRGGPEAGTRMSVMLRDSQTNASYWEGRAEFEVSERSSLAAGPANAQAISNALFSEFPGASAGPVQVRVNE